MIKEAQTDYPIADVLRTRWSPYGFAPRTIAPGVLSSVFEAARWAPSAYNEQPWRFIVARREESEEFQRLLSCLVTTNQEWARHASALALGVIMQRFSRNDRPNATAAHDLGLAAASLTVEATARGLAVHQMSGIHPDQARTIYGIPESAAPLTALAIGYASEPGGSNDPYRERDSSPRMRRKLDATVFQGSWNRSASWLRVPEQD